MISNLSSTNKIIIAVCIILFILLIIYYFWWGDSIGGNKEGFDQKKYIQGLWEGVPEFCDQADLDNMVLYIGDEESRNKYSSYFIISNKSDNGNTGIMKQINIKFSNGNVYIEDNDTDPDDDIESNSDVDISEIIPPQLKYEINYNTGKMTFTDTDGKVWAYLYKNNAA